ncbi:DUF2341 domain-containing protein [Xanthomonas maliensis]|uniref:DUF2341 domain-containing protein n=1 Tax=Xanthomonas maliensis TaxID=1321368 RepID=UPI0004CED3CF|nr:DUF2341 domain-containing protein [Xanthomonas maliensis]KAB7765035.1 DUF2341 domain-containing protein [Xanthomonas maliensis]
MSKLRLCVLLGLLLTALPAMAASWWDGKWNFRAKLTLNTTPTGAALEQPAGRVQVLVRLHSGNFNFADAKPDGSDVRFIAGDDRTPLKYHFEKYDGLVDQVALAWVDLPALPANASTPIYVYFGNPEASAGEDAKQSYDADTLAVYHFANAQAATQDATGYANALSGPVASADSALIGAGLRLDGKAPVSAPASASLNLPAGSPFTLSAWVKPAAGATSGVLFALPGALTVLLENGSLVVEPSGGTRLSSSMPLAADAWTHVAVRGDGRQLALYINGSPAGETSASLPAASAGLLLGGEPGAARPNLIGMMDEVELSKVARPVAAIVAAARSQGVEARLATFEPVEQRSGEGGHGYFGILLNALTPDAWAVIAILAVMALISWWVMISKGLYLNATASANARFLGLFRQQVAQQPLHAPTWQQLQAAGSLDGQRSNLARLLQVGLEELRGRLASSGNAVVRTQSIAAIRSALDAAAVREGQRIHKGMVLLTIAISGGPFLGLLGTVVGVMITFAAVAAAGDVNINAIAPGIAAALLATVAGLAVAIPALFGYNYLLSQADAVAADMQVFVDELEKRIAEDYAGDAPARLAGG